ncbi:unnamed protein product [Pleuronectes platessa]|uniref:Death domain-containing protein n=1 Tax=Pleuronectes platessa TaxID=8262 RepID=A0A9N7TMQ6_PLEPL|nr:unnamed protein product [Pleuronectes platessa]
MSGFEEHGYEQRESLRQQETRRRNNVLGSEEHGPDVLCGRVNNLWWICNHSRSSVAEDVGSHQLQRLVEMLTHTECEDLLVALSHPEENIFQHLQRLSPENNQLDIKPRARRDTSSSEDSEAECRTALTDWLLRYGERIYYDKLSRSLMHIGRTDIAIEVGTNVNEDKTSNLKRFVDGYHEYVRSLDVPSVRSEAKRPRAAGRKRKRKGKEKVSHRKQTEARWDVVLPVLYGVLLGFGGSLLAGVSIILIALHVSRRAATTTPRVTTPRVTTPTPRVTGSSRSKLKNQGHWDLSFQTQTGDVTCRMQLLGDNIEFHLHQQNSHDTTSLVLSVSLLRCEDPAGADWDRLTCCGLTCVPGTSGEESQCSVCMNNSEEQHTTWDLHPGGDTPQHRPGPHQEASLVADEGKLQKAPPACSGAPCNFLTARLSEQSHLT